MYIKMHFSIPETVDRRDPKGSVYTVRNIFILLTIFSGRWNWGCKGVHPQFLAKIGEKAVLFKTSKSKTTLI